MLVDITTIEETEEEAFEVLATSIDKEEFSKPPPNVEFKPLPPLLNKCIDDACTYPVIVNSNLNDISISKLIETLQKYKDVIGYSIDNLKGISLSLSIKK